MSKVNLIVIGAGGHARACIDVIEQCGQYEIVGLIGKPNELNAMHFGYTVFATDQDLPTVARTYQHAFIAIGQIQTPIHRIRLFQHATELGFQLPVIVAPTAFVSRHAIIGAGTVLMHGAIVNAGAKVGKNCIINTRALVEHDATVADHCHISTGAIVNGGANVGVGSFIGSGSIVKEGVLIGKTSLVGMGLVVRHNLGDHSHFVGCHKS
jgi:sugar O-acyltransferase (sialic acid O-acetyltransferase NeuD family)